MLVTPPCGASSNIALWRAKIKPPVELVVGDLELTKKNMRRKKQKKSSPKGFPKFSERTQILLLKQLAVEG